MENHKRNGYQSMEYWPLFEMTVLKFHYQGLILIEDHEHPNDIPSSEELAEFESKLHLPDEMYKILYRELYKIAKHAMNYEDGDQTFKGRINHHPNTSNPAKKYYMALAVAKEMREDIWQLCADQFENEDPFTATGCRLCNAHCECHTCDRKCISCKKGTKHIPKCKLRQINKTN